MFGLLLSNVCPHPRQDLFSDLGLCDGKCYMILGGSDLGLVTYQIHVFHDFMPTSAQYSFFLMEFESNHLS